MSQYFVKCLTHFFYLRCCWHGGIRGLTKSVRPFVILREAFMGFNLTREPIRQDLLTHAWTNINMREWMICSEIMYKRLKYSRESLESDPCSGEVRLIGYGVIMQLHNRFPLYSKWADTFRSDFLFPIWLQIDVLFWLTL